MAAGARVLRTDELVQVVDRRGHLPGITAQGEALRSQQVVDTVHHLADVGVGVGVADLDDGATGDPHHVSGEHLDLIEAVLDAGDRALPHDDARAHDVQFVEDRAQGAEQVTAAVGSDLHAGGALVVALAGPLHLGQANQLTHQGCAALRVDESPVGAALVGHQGAPWKDARTSTSRRTTLSGSWSTVTRYSAIGRSGQSNRSPSYAFTKLLTTRLVPLKYAVT